jgi:isopentenyldiphosphate isomerase
VSAGTGGSELVDVVDDEDRVVATVTRARMRAERLRHRGVFIVIRRPDGRVLVHQRSAAKDIWPSAWDVAVGGVVTAGESWEDAATRELAEEVGIEGATLRLARAGRYADADVDEVARVYMVTWEGAVRFVDGEVVAAEWLTPTELAERVARRPFCPDSLALTVDLLAGVRPRRPDGTT